MAETTDDVPDWAKIWLDLDTAQWLHELADRDYGGDINVALNSVLRAEMARTAKPQDKWAGLEVRRKTLRR